MQWSHMLGVRPEYRASGIGRELKLEQRRVSLAMGIDLMEWTFDPLVAVNARLNFSRLGVEVEEYVVNVYGDSVSPLHRGAPTDRFIAQWRMRSPRVEAVLDGSGAPAGEEAWTDVPRVNDVGREGGWLVCAGCDLARSDPRLAVAIPPRFTDMLERQPETARAWRMATREIFTAYLSRVPGRRFRVRPMPTGASTCWRRRHQAPPAHLEGGATAAESSGDGFHGHDHHVPRRRSRRRRDRPLHHPHGPAAQGGGEGSARRRSRCFWPRSALRGHLRARVLQAARPADRRSASCSARATAHRLIGDRARHRGASDFPAKYHDALVRAAISARQDTSNTRRRSTSGRGRAGSQPVTPGASSSAGRPARAGAGGTPSARLRGCS